MTSEDAADLNIQLSDLNYICLHVPPASNCHYFKNQMRLTTTRIPPCALPQVKIELTSPGYSGNACFGRSNYFKRVRG